MTGKIAAYIRSFPAFLQDRDLWPAIQASVRVELVVVRFRTREACRAVIVLDISW